ncbi:MAG: bifunctional 2-polyprenyl-6-hydroxyphenol methylase/3-demethylubiquinol 3-O-methyltransferase UbiG [Roseiarcus sp.]|jgi:2-polyprenyl-6-hydroxyphenyl methylase/3-demethylubiquinone-9 3-methyltransferase
MSGADRSVIAEEVARFDALGDDWWDPNGPMAPLHQLNPARLEWLRDTIAAHFRHTGGGDEPPLAGLSLLDIGCGAGLLSEPLSRLGASVVGLDPAPASIAVARTHAEATGATASYRVGTVEDLAKEHARFDVVLAMEVVEHVADVPAFVAAAASLIKPGGLFALATLNRTLKSFALAIVGAEYVLRWLPPGTHRWEQFVTPDELAAALRAAGLKETQRRGMSFDPLRGEWRLSRDLGVNYFIAARRG